MKEQVTGELLTLFVKKNMQSLCCQRLEAYLYHLRKAFQDVQILINANKAKRAEDLLKEKNSTALSQDSVRVARPGKRATARRNTNIQDCI